MIKKQEFKVGDLVKDKWGASSKVDDWKKKLYSLTVDLFIPPMGIIKNIKTVTKKLKNGASSTVEVAEIDWTIVKIPELNAETNKWELDHYNKYRNKMQLKHIAPYQIYYKNLLKRKLKKTT